MYLLIEAFSTDSRQGSPIHRLKTFCENQQAYIYTGNDLTINKKPRVYAVKSNPKILAAPIKPETVEVSSLEEQVSEKLSVAIAEENKEFFHMKAGKSSDSSYTPKSKNVEMI